MLGTLEVDAHGGWAALGAPRYAAVGDADFEAKRQVPPPQPSPPARLLLCPCWGNVQQWTMSMRGVRGGVSTQART